jgi:hypothetical protein
MSWRSVIAEGGDVRMMLSLDREGDCCLPFRHMLSLIGRFMVEALENRE